VTPTSSALKVKIEQALVRSADLDGQRITVAGKVTEGDGALLGGTAGGGASGVVGAVAAVDKRITVSYT
jgi:hypothetical protein